MPLKGQKRSPEAIAKAQATMAAKRLGEVLTLARAARDAPEKPRATTIKDAVLFSTVAIADPPSPPLTPAEEDALGALAVGIRERLVVAMIGACPILLSDDAGVRFLLQRAKNLFRYVWDDDAGGE